MNKKAEAWKQYLEANKIDCFAEEVVDNELHTTIYRTNLGVSGQNLPCAVVMDDSIYTMFQVLVGAKLVKDANRSELEHYFNDLNKNYKVFKYYVNEAGDICLDSCLPSSAENFEPALLQAVINVVLQHLEKEYDKLMKLVWAN